MGWMARLSNDVYNRLCNCRTIKADLPQLVNAKYAAYRDNKRYTKEDALVEVLELLDENGVSIDLTIEEYNDLI